MFSGSLITDPVSNLSNPKKWTLYDHPRPRRLFQVTQRWRELERFFLCNQQSLIRFNLWEYDLRYQIRYLKFRKGWINIINYYKMIMNVSILSPFYLSPLFAFDSAILNFEILIPDSWSATPKTYGNTIDTHCKSSTKMCPLKG